MCLLENAEAQMLGSPSVSRGRCYADWLVLKQLRVSLLEGRGGGSSWSSFAKNRCCFPLEGVLEAKVYFQGLVDVTCEWRCCNSFNRELIYPTVTRSCFLQFPGLFSLPPCFSFSFSLKKHDCVIDVSYIFTTMQPPPQSSFRTMPAPWRFSSRSFILNPCSQQPLGNYWFAFHSHSISSLQKFHVNGIKQCVVFCVWFLSLNVLVSRFIHVCRAPVASSNVLA